MSAFCFYVISRSSNEQEKRALCNCLLDRLSVTYITTHHEATSSGVTLPFGAPLLIFFAAPTKILVSKKKKGRHFFFGFSYRLLAPLGLFVPQIFFSRRPNAKLAEIWSILLPSRTIFRLKNSKFCNMPPPPPLRCRPCIAGVAGAVVKPLITRLLWDLDKSNVIMWFVPWLLLQWSLPRLFYNITPFKNVAKDSLPMPRQYKQSHFVLMKISLFLPCPSKIAYVSYIVTYFINNTSKIRNFDYS